MTYVRRRKLAPLELLHPREVAQYLGVTLPELAGAMLAGELPNAIYPADGASRVMLRRKEVLAYEAERSRGAFLLELGVIAP